MGRFEKVDGIPTIAMPRTPQATLLRGAVGCGKTQRLVDGVRDLLRQGADAASILVLCATPDAARAFSVRLDAPEVRVCSAREQALDLLARPDAVALFGHGPRVLLPYEEDILFEDVKVCGLEIDRLEGMLLFFKRSMTEIADDHPDFLVDDDESSAMAHLRRALDLRGAYIEQQISANAARYLASSHAPIGYAHVFVDDFQLLCRASQVMSGLLATESLCVAVDPATVDPVFESYPRVTCVDEFLMANPQANVVELDAFAGSARVLDVVNALRAEMGLSPCEASVSQGANAEGSVSLAVLSDPKAEIDHAANLIAEAVELGTDPADIYVVSPVRAWSERLASALGARGVRCELACNLSECATSSADPTSNAGYLRVLTALLLAGDAGDDTAWRSWCAFDDPLAASGAIDAVARAVGPLHTRLHEALGWLASRLAETAALTQHHDVQRVVDRYLDGCELLERVRGLCRDDLLRALTNELCGEGEPVPAPVARLCAGAPQTADARALREHVLHVTSFPGWETPRSDFEGLETGPDNRDGNATEDAVRIGDMGRMCGLSPRLVVFIGFVNGFFPEHGFFDETVTPPGKVATARTNLARKLCSAVGKSHEDLTFTAFSTIPCADAERFGIKIDRIALVKRVRTARTSASVFCSILKDELGLSAE